tara:strand:- start:249 stop:794 length:546 start_codon:yes stop_codon:yes gene_type:complete
VEKISKGSYLVGIYGTSFLSLLMMWGGLIVMISAGMYGNPYYMDEEMILVGVVIMLIGFIVSTISVVLWCILTHKLWAAIQGPSSRTTPGQAVGLMFVPFFNLYWWFQAVWGWSVDYNKHIKDKGVVVPPVSEGVGLAWCVLCCVGIIPFVGYLTAIPQLVLMIIWHSQSIDAVNALIEKS